MVKGTNSGVPNEYVCIYNVTDAFGLKMGMAKRGLLQDRRSRFALFGHLTEQLPVVGRH